MPRSTGPYGPHKTYTCRLPEVVWQRLQEASEQSGIKVRSLMRIALAEAVMHHDFPRNIVRPIEEQRPPPLPPGAVGERCTSAAEQVGDAERQIIDRSLEARAARLSGRASS